VIEALAQNLGLGALLEALRSDFGGYDVVDHWQQGEFHHDLVIRIVGQTKLPGPVLVVATNCNGGVKEVLCFSTLPEHDALWHHRCPDNPDFRGELAPVLASARTVHWFDPCELLTADARSEYLPEHRERQPGGGWRLKGCAAKTAVAAD
jgi:hypothetical protein